MDQPNSRSAPEQLEGIPELIQNIQSRLPVKAAACTSVLSKSWLRAWSTIPTLRFYHIPNPIFWYEQGYEEAETNSLQLIDIEHILDRYLRENIPIETFELVIEIENERSADFATKWLRSLASKTHVKEISLEIKLSFEKGQRYFELPLEILSCENLTKLRVTADSLWKDSVTMSSTHPMIIKCLSLRELHLDSLGVSQKILDGLLSSCSSLEKVQLSWCSRHLNTIKVKNLPRLYKLIIYIDASNENPTDFVILSHLPNLRCVVLYTRFKRPFNAHSISLGTSVTKLSLLGGLSVDYTSLDMIKSGCPFLESLSLNIGSWRLGSFHFICASLKSLFLHSCPRQLTDVQIHAPKLSHFQYSGCALPDLLFPISSTLKQLRLELDMKMHVDASFFLKLRETLTLSSKCYLHIKTYNCTVPLDMDVNDLRRRLLLPPARNVELTFRTDEDECQWHRSCFFDAFFEICHPEQVFARRDLTFRHNNHFCRLMLKEVLEKKETGPTMYWPHYLEHVQINPSPFTDHEYWETLKNAHRSLLDGSTPNVCLDFKLQWCSRSSLVN